jgi:glucose-1-phosphate adenylyltransferase
MLRTLALILAGGSAPALSVLSTERAEAAIPFAGKFRIVDFSLSNCVNSGIYHVGVLTQYRPRSLHEHLGVGRPWDLDRAKGGLRILHPSPTPEGGGWQRGTADAVRYNLDFIQDQPVDAVLMLAGDHVYMMDYRPLLQFHQDRNADITLAVHSVSSHEAYRYGIVSADPHNNVTGFTEKPRRPSGGLASMGVYVIKKDFLIDVLANSTDVHFGNELLPRLVAQDHVNAYSYHFPGYWADVGTIQAYYEANMALLAETPALDLYNLEWVVHTQSSQRPGADVHEDARVENSLICDGSQVEGYVTRSIISPGVVISREATVRDSIILNDAWIGPGAVIDRCIIDEDARIEGGAMLGDGQDNTPNKETPDWLNTGLTLIGTRAHVPENVRVGRNVIIRPRTNAEAFGQNNIVASGATVGP